MIKSTLMSLTFLCSTVLFSQNVPDSIKAAKKARDKDYSFSYKATVVDSTDVIAQFIDMNFGNTCKIGPNAGIGVFKIIEAGKKLPVDTMCVVFQCAFDGPYMKLFSKGKKYKMTITPYRVKYWVDVEWDQYMRHKRYFLVGKDPVPVK